MNNLPYENKNLDDLPGEIWVDALGFDGQYAVSNLGRIKTLQRFVNTHKGQRRVSERILSQCRVKDGRLTVVFSVNNQKTSINVSALIYLSFNLDEEYDVSKYCVMHKNKCKHDNRLFNLKIETISKSHSVNNEKGLLQHLHDFNEKKRKHYQSLTHKQCSKCKKTKPISSFELGRRKCKTCRAAYKKEYYINVLKKKNNESIYS